MRRIGLLTAAALLLAGCAPEDKAADGGSNVVAIPTAPPAPEAAAPEPAPPAVAAIPEPFHGVYDSSPEACGRPSDGRLTVSALELRFHESIGTVRSVVSAPSGATRVEADYQGEGESWRSYRELRLSDGGESLTISGDGTRMVRVRCPGGER